MPENEADPCPKTARWSAERCASLRRGTQGASQAPGLPRQRRGDARGFASKTRVNARLTRQAERVLATPVHRLGAPLPLGRGRAQRSKLGRGSVARTSWAV